MATNTVSKLFKNLHKEEDKVVVPTDKVNNYTVVETYKYITWVEAHLAKAAKPLPQRDVVKFHKEATTFADSIQNFISAEEYGFFQERVKSKAIPQLQLLVKDHKPVKGITQLPNVPCYPCNKLHLCVLKTRILGNQKVLDKHYISYSKHTSL
eukprot:5498603-Ditylum_brightwellii.AAC.1